MKKIVFLLVTVLVLSLTIGGIALAGDKNAEGISTVEEGVSPSNQGSGEVAEGSDEDYVGKDLELEEGQMGIVSIEDVDAVEEPDLDVETISLELDDADRAVSSDGEDYVGKDLVLKEGEVGIVSIDESALESAPVEEHKNNLPIYGGILLIIAAGLSFVVFKKVVKA